MCICIYIYTHHIEDYKGMFETPDQYVMGHITCTSKNISTAFRITSRRWINVCVCVHGRAKVSWAHAPGHPVQKPIELQSLRC